MGRYGQQVTKAGDISRVVVVVVVVDVELSVRKEVKGDLVY